MTLWNHFDSIKRTNNYNEGYNSKLNKFFNTHPNIWVYIKKIQAEESTAYLKFSRLSNESFKNRGRDKKDVQRDLYMQTCKVELISKKVDIYSYLERVSAAVHTFGE